MLSFVFVSGLKYDSQTNIKKNDVLNGIADKYVAYLAPRSGAVDRDIDKVSVGNENGFVLDIVGPELTELLMEDGMPKESTSEVGIFDHAFSS